MLLTIHCAACRREVQDGWSGVNGRGDGGGAGGGEQGRDVHLPLGRLRPGHLGGSLLPDGGLHPARRPHQVHAQAPPGLPLTRHGSRRVSANYKLQL